MCAARCGQCGGAGLREKPAAPRFREAVTVDRTTLDQAAVEASALTLLTQRDRRHAARHPGSAVRDGDEGARRGARNSRACCTTGVPGPAPGEVGLRNRVSPREFIQAANYPVQGVVEEMLADGGFATDILSSGEEALTFFATSSRVRAR